jgi:hypothetical protein
MCTISQQPVHIDDFCSLVVMHNQETSTPTLTIQASWCAGQNVQASQQYVSSKVSWFTGGFFRQLFQVDPLYGMPPASLNAGHCHCSLVPHDFMSTRNGQMNRINVTNSINPNVLLRYLHCAVRRKLVLLLAPFLGSFDYIRQVENMAANVPVMKPPREDLFAPDLYIPLQAMFSYVVLTALNKFANGIFKPEVMYSMVWSLYFNT